LARPRIPSVPKYFRGIYAAPQPFRIECSHPQENVYLGISAYGSVKKMASGPAARPAPQPAYKVLLGESYSGSGHIEPAAISPGSGPGLSRPPRFLLAPVSNARVAGRSPATTGRM